MCTKASRYNTEFVANVYEGKQIYYRVHRYAQSKKQQRYKCRKKERTKAVLEQQQSLTGMITIISELLDVCWRRTATRSGYAKHSTSRKSISLLLDVCRRRSATRSRRIKERHICSPTCVLEKSATRSGCAKHASKEQRQHRHRFWRSCAGKALT
jgi:hypothetical protein